MNGYLLSIIGTVLVCAVLTAILPSGKTSGIIKGIAKLACVIAIISPIPQFLENGISSKLTNKKNTNKFAQTVIQTDESFIKYYCEMRVNNAETALNKEILEKFSMDVDSKMTWRFSNKDVYDVDEVLITSIAIKMNDEASTEMNETIKNYVTQNYCCEVYIE